MRTDRVRGWLALIFLVLCLLLGGASARGAGAVGNALLQVLALLLILFSLWTRGGTAYPAQARGVSWIVALYLLLVLASLVPLPAGLWGGLPGREAIVAGYALLGIEPPAAPVTLSWSNSVASIMWLLPPIAIFLAVQQAAPRTRARLAWAIIIVAAVSIALGAAQLLGGEQSRLRFYQITNPNAPVGFFANTNHLATLLLCSLPLAAFLAARAARKERAPDRSGGLLVAGGLALLLIVGIATTGSLAGYLLAIPVGVASLLIHRYAVRGRIGSRWLAAMGVAFVLFVGLAVSGPVSRQSLTEELSVQPSSRATIAATTMEAVKAHFPVGSGLGTFQEVYREYEDPDVVTGSYTNHAHNDYLEVALELGVPGILLVLAFLFWWGRRSIDVWTSNYEGSNLARAGSAMVLVVVLHSIADYPVRTSAIAAVFAFACALLVPYSAPVDRRSAEPRGDRPRHLEAE